MFSTALVMKLVKVLIYACVCVSEFQMAALSGLAIALLCTWASLPALITVRPLHTV